MSQRRNQIWKYAVLLLFVVLFIEGLAFVACKVLARAGFLYWSTPVTGYARYMAERDAELGWPAQHTRGHGEIDASGSRLVPAFPDPSVGNCVALFGDSFTYGEEVSPADAYGNVLAQALGCRVANFGVGGYGTDQAVLRYEQLRPDARVVVLGHFSEDIIRNVNQDRAFLGNPPLGLKPRFVLREGRLDLLPLPTFTESEYARIEREPDEFLPHDFFRPGGPSGVAAARFPFMLSALRALGHYRLKAALRREPSYAQFYRPDHPSQSLTVTVEIMKRFVATARSRGQAPLVLLIPDVKDLDWLRAHGTPPYQQLVEQLTAAKVPFVSAAEPLDRYLDGAVPCTLYSRCGGGHFKPAGYRELAMVVQRSIRDLHLLAVAPPKAE